MKGRYINNNLVLATTVSLLAACGGGGDEGGSGVAAKSYNSIDDYDGKVTPVEFGTIPAEEVAQEATDSFLIDGMLQVLNRDIDLDALEQNGLTNALKTEVVEEIESEAAARAISDKSVTGVGNCRHGGQVELTMNGLTHIIFNYLGCKAVSDESLNGEISVRLVQAGEGFNFEIDTDYSRTYPGEGGSRQEISTIVDSVIMPRRNGFEMAVEALIVRDGTSPVQLNNGSFYISNGSVDASGELLISEYGALDFTTVETIGYGSNRLPNSGTVKLVGADNYTVFVEFQGGNLGVISHDLDGDGVIDSTSTFNWY